MDALRRIEAASEIRSRAYSKRLAQKVEVLRPGIVAVVDPRSEKQRYREIVGALGAAPVAVEPSSDQNPLQDR